MHCSEGVWRGPSDCDRLHESRVGRAERADESTRRFALQIAAHCLYLRPAYRRGCHARSLSSSALGVAVRVRLGWSERAAVGATGDTADHHQSVQLPCAVAGDRPARAAGRAADRTAAGAASAPVNSNPPCAGFFWPACRRRAVVRCSWRRRGAVRAGGRHFVAWRPIQGSFIAHWLHLTPTRSPSC